MALIYKWNSDQLQMALIYKWNSDQLQTHQ